MSFVVIYFVSFIVAIGNQPLAAMNDARSANNVRRTNVAQSANNARSANNVRRTNVAHSANNARSANNVRRTNVAQSANDARSANNVRRTMSHKVLMTRAALITSAGPMSHKC